MHVSTFSKPRSTSCGPRIPASTLQSLSPRLQNESSPYLHRHRESQTKQDTPVTPSSRPFLHGCGVTPAGPRVTNWLVGKAHIGASDPVKPTSVQDEGVSA